MATAPMTDPVAQTPAAAPAADPSAGATDSGYTIEIKVDGQGGITVGVESAGEESSEESGDQGAAMGAAGGEGADDSDSGQSVPDWKTAMQVASDIYKNAGQMRDTSGDEQAGFDEAAA